MQWVSTEFRLRIEHIAHNEYICNRNDFSISHGKQYKHQRTGFWTKQYLNGDQEEGNYDHGLRKGLWVCLNQNQTKYEESNYKLVPFSCQYVHNPVFFPLS